MVDGDTVTSVRVDKYQPRFDALVTLPDGRDVSNVLLGRYVVPYKGGKREIKPSS